MPIRVVIYGQHSDGAAYAAMAQIRSLIRELNADASVLIITDERQLKMNGVTDTPSVSVDGTLVSFGYVPSRMEMQRFLKQRMDALGGTPS
jgi:hypothetical protein